MTAAALIDRAQRLGGASAAADDLAVVIVVDRQLEHERAVVLLELLDLDALGLVDERAGEVLEQSRTRGPAYRPLGWMPCVLRSFRTGSHGWAPRSSQWRMRSSSRTMVDGSVCGVVAADGLDEATVARGAAVGDDDAPQRVLLARRRG